MPRLRLPASRQQPCHTTFARDRHVPCRRQRLAQPSPTRNPLDCAGWLVLSQCLASLGRVGAPRLSLQAINCRSDDCPFTANDAESLIDSVLIRSRIRPTDFQIQQHLEHTNGVILQLKTVVQCLDPDARNHIFAIDVYFAITLVDFTPGDNLFLPILLDKNFGTFGIGGRDYILETIKSAIERAATIYIRAHMER